jgi:uncharacterized protein YcnI
MRTCPLTERALHEGGTLRKVRILVGALLATTVVALWSGAAFAHVTIQPPTADKGSYGRFVFRVPNESATASTIKLEVQFPADKPLQGVRYQPKDGWDIAIEKAKLATPIKSEGGSDITDYVSKITWTAKEGVKIAPDQFDEFGFSVGPLPKDQTQVAVKAVQTYDSPLADGTSEARWVEVREEGKPDPKRPEPIIKLTEPKPAEGTAGAVAAAATGKSQETAAATTEASDTASSARNIAIIGLILALIAGGLAIAAFVTRGKSDTPAPTTEA